MICYTDALVVMALAVICYTNALSGALIFDDEAAITENRDVTAADEEVSVDAYEVIQESISGLDIGGIISAFLGTAATVAENLLYIFLFLAFMLFGEESEEDEEAEAARRNSLSVTRSSQRRGSVDVDAQAPIAGGLKEKPIP